MKFPRQYSQGLRQRFSNTERSHSRARAAEKITAEQTTNWEQIFVQKKKTTTNAAKYQIYRRRTQGLCISQCFSFRCPGLNFNQHYSKKNNNMRTENRTSVLPSETEKVGEFRNEFTFLTAESYMAVNWCFVLWKETWNSWRFENFWHLLWQHKHSGFFFQ